MNRHDPKQPMSRARQGTRGLLLAFVIVFAAGSRTAVVARPRVNAATLVALSGFVGAVFDSVHDGPLVGASVTVLQTTLRATTDEQGRYRIDSLPAGSYKLHLAHAILDTIGLDLTTKVIDVPAGHYAVVALATPSPRSIRALFCPGQDTIAAPSLLLGRVRDADTGAPAPGTNVSLVFSELRASKETGVSRQPRMRAATVEADGVYAFCGLPPNVRARLQAERAGATTADIEVLMQDQVLALRSMTIGTRTGAEGGGASVAGRVVDSLNVPIAGAQVSVSGTTASTVSATSGEFILTSLPSGTHELVAHRVGLAAGSLLVELTSRETRRVTVRLGQAVSALSPVVIKAKIDIGLARVGFLDRKLKSSTGHFIGPADIERLQPHEASDLLNATPGLQVMTSSGQKIVMTRRSAVGQASACVNVFADGIPWESRTPGDFDASFPVADIAAVETYPGSAVPHEFVVPGKSCSTIVLWTKVKTRGG